MERDSVDVMLNASPLFEVDGDVDREPPVESFRIFAEFVDA